jgi:GPH family glycoside/pentoside/hexuronide:cation symporter
MSARRSNWTLAAFAAPCLPLAGLGLPLVVYLPEFYASELGLGLAQVGAAFAAVRLLDMAFDPFIGGVMDGSRTRFGRFRPWFALAAPILMLATAMLFMAKPGVTTVYLWTWLLVLYAGVSISSLAHLAWGAAISPEYNQRSRIYAWWQGGNVVGMILVLTLPALLPFVGVKGHAQAVGAMGWFVVLLLPLTVALAVWRVPEPLVTKPKERSGFAEYFKLMARPSVVRILIVDFLVGTGPAITGALFFFFFVRAKGFEKSTASLLLLVYFIGGLVGAPIWTWLAYRIGKHRTLAVSSLFYAAVTVAALTIPHHNMAVGALMMFLAGITYAAGAFLLRAMMADVGDEVRLDTGIDRTALLYALLSGTVKVGSATAVFVTFTLLGKLGFDPKAHTGEAGVFGLSMMFSVVPATLAVVASGIIAGFPLTEKRHGEIRAALVARDLADASLADAAPAMGAQPRFTEEIHVATPAAE